VPSCQWSIFLVTSANFFLSQFYRASNAVIADDLLKDLCLDTQGLGQTVWRALLPFPQATIG